MLGRLRLIAVRWLLLAVLSQVVTPAHAAVMGGRMCAQMAAEAAASASAEQAAALHAMHMAMGMDMSGMDMAAVGHGDMAGMGHGAGAHDDGSGDRHDDSCCDFQCCTGALGRIAAPPPPLWSLPAPVRYVVASVWFDAPPAPVRAAEARLRPAIRAPPA